MRLSFVIAYYDNPAMLAEQYRVWSTYGDEAKAAIEVCLVDDGSPRWPAVEVPRPPGLPALRIFRFLEDRPWNQDAARNLGAHMARHPWLLCTDMDHVVPAATLDVLLAQKNKGLVYTFGRVDAPGLTPTLGPDGRPKPHPNSFAMTRALFWKVGGYDEAYSGRGVYGTDGMFLARARGWASFHRLADAPLIRYPRTVIADASTTTLSRERTDLKREIAAEKEAAGQAAAIETLTQAWERVL
ncbi:MAG: glycosyltransferase family 2 protein [Alphaproteobacteria bacterium]